MDANRRRSIYMQQQQQKQRRGGLEVEQDQQDGASESSYRARRKASASSTSSASSASVNTNESRPGCVLAQSADEQRRQRAGQRRQSGSNERAADSSQQPLASSQGEPAAHAFRPNHAEKTSSSSSSSNKNKNKNKTKNKTKTNNLQEDAPQNCQPLFDNNFNPSKREELLRHTKSGHQSVDQFGQPSPPSQRAAGQQQWNGHCTRNGPRQEQPSSDESAGRIATTTTTRPKTGPRAGGDNQIAEPSRPGEEDNNKLRAGQAPNEGAKSKQQRKREAAAATRRHGMAASSNGRPASSSEANSGSPSPSPAGHYYSSALAVLSPARASLDKSNQQSQATMQNLLASSLLSSNGPQASLMSQTTMARSENEEPLVRSSSWQNKTVIDLNANNHNNNDLQRKQRDLLHLNLKAQQSSCEPGESCIDVSGINHHSANLAAFEQDCYAALNDNDCQPPMELLTNLDRQQMFVERQLFHRQQQQQMQNHHHHHPHHLMGPKNLYCAVQTLRPQTNCDQQLFYTQNTISDNNSHQQQQNTASRQFYNPAGQHHQSQHYKPLVAEPRKEAADYGWPEERLAYSIYKSPTTGSFQSASTLRYAARRPLGLELAVAGCQPPPLPPPLVVQASASIATSARQVQQPVFSSSSGHHLLSSANGSSSLDDASHSSQCENVANNFTFHWTSGTQTRKQLAEPHQLNHQDHFGRLSWTAETGCKRRREPKNPSKGAKCKCCCPRRSLAALILVSPLQALLVFCILVPLLGLASYLALDYSRQQQQQQQQQQQPSGALEWPSLFPGGQSRDEQYLLRQQHQLGRSAFAADSASTNINNNHNNNLAPSGPDLGGPSSVPPGGAPDLFPPNTNVIKQQQQQQQTPLDVIGAASGELLLRRQQKWPQAPAKQPQQLDTANGYWISGDSGSEMTNDNANKQQRIQQQQLQQQQQQQQQQQRRAELISWCRQATGDCQGNGQCLSAQCFCSAGHSGLNCARNGCPRNCSQRGECKMRSVPPRASSSKSNLAQWCSPAASSDINTNNSSFEELFAQRATEMDKPNNGSGLLVSWAAATGGETRYYEHSIEWFCECHPGSGGSDCSRPKELSCNDQLDNDADGLIDCEDEDCCEQPICRDNLMCVRSPDPSKLLEERSSSTPAAAGQQQQQQLMAHGWPKLEQLAEANEPSNRFFNQWKFLISNGSVQSYALEWAYEKPRVASIRGKVVKLLEQDHQDRPPIVSVRVSVLEYPAFGFTLTRLDGHFDMLVNGDEWLTLIFHRQAYTPLKRRLFVRPNRINVLPDLVQMWQQGAPGAEPEPAPNKKAAPSKDSQTSGPDGRHEFAILGRWNQAPFLGLDASLELASLEQQQQQLTMDQQECLLDRLFERKNVNGRRLEIFEPVILIDRQESPINKLRTFVFSPRRVSDSDPHPNTAAPSISVQLLPCSYAANRTANLRSIVVILNIEGQQERVEFAERQLLAGLAYEYTWNRRNVYQQKVYAFAELHLRVEYEYDEELQDPRTCRDGRLLNLDSTLLDNKGTFGTQTNSGGRFAKHSIVYQQKLFLEAHHPEQLLSNGKWTVGSNRRFDNEHQLVHFFDPDRVWMLPFRLVYPPVAQRPTSLANPIWHESARPQLLGSAAATAAADGGGGGGGNLLARGPNFSVFTLVWDGRANSVRLVQFMASPDSDKQLKPLLDVPLSVIASRFNVQLPKKSSENAGQLAHLADDLHLLYNQFDSSLYISSKTAARLVRVTMTSLQLLNKTFNSNGATLGPDDEIDIEPVCGFHLQQSLQSASHHYHKSSLSRPCKPTKFESIHSLSLDTQNQLLYFVAGASSIMALDLESKTVANLTNLMDRATRSRTEANQDRTSGGIAWLVGGGLAQEKCPIDRSAWNQFLARHYRPKAVQSLVWSRADSSLYFIDRDAILALRADLNIDLIALGAGGEQKTGLAASLQMVCNQDTWQQQQRDANHLGSIKSIALDESNGFELLIVHQWPGLELASGDKRAPKMRGRFYLAKVPLGIKIANTKGMNGKQARHTLADVFDLHSSESTWDPLIRSVAHKSARDNNATIDWLELARRPQTRRPGVDWIPFINLMTPELAGVRMGGFERVNSISIRPDDGTIFLLDWQDQSLHSITPYCPSEFNRVFRTDRTKANRPSQENQANFDYQGAEKEVLKELNIGPTNTSLVLRNPTDSEEKMEFYWPSGLLTSSKFFHL